MENFQVFKFVNRGNGHAGTQTLITPKDARRSGC